MTSFFDYEKLYNPIINLLKTPPFEDTINAIIELKAVLLIPHGAALGSYHQAEFSRSFIASHIALCNPVQSEEILTINGLVCLLESIGEVRFLKRLTGRMPVKVDIDKGVVFNAKKEVWDNYRARKGSKEDLVTQSVQVLREGEIILKRKSVPIILIEEPLQYPGCAWEASLKAQTISFSEIVDSSQNQAVLSYRELFWKKMKKANDIVNRIKGFMDNFVNNKGRIPVKDRGNYVHEFISEVIQTFQLHPLWKTAPKAELEEAYECIEKYIMTKLYDHCFGDSPEYTSRDEEISKKLKTIQWITPEHLEIGSEYQSSRRFSTAINELRKMDNYKSPKDKLTCILNCCKVIYSILNKANKGPAGTDDFLPLLIYTVLKSNFEKFQTNIYYIQSYRSPNKLSSESSCYLTHLYAAVNFVETLDASDLKITQQEYYRLVNEKATTVQIDNPTVTVSPQPLITESTPIIITLNQNPNNNDQSTSTTPTNSLSITPIKPDIDFTSSNSIDIPRPPSPSKTPNNNTPQTIFFSDSECGTDSADSIILEEDIVITDSDIQRFVSSRCDDLRIRDIPKLLAILKQLYTENIKLKETLENKPKQ